MNKVKMFLEYLFSNEYVPSSKEEALSHLNLSDEELEECSCLFDKLKQEQILVMNGNKKYLVDNMGEYVVGVFSKSKKGFGFISPLDSGDDIYVYHTNVNGATTGDIVLSRISRPATKSKSSEAIVREVIVPVYDKVVGVFHSFGEYGYVMPDAKNFKVPIVIREEYLHGVVEGDKAVARITERKANGFDGEIIEILGNKDEAGVDILSIVRQNDVNITFPPEVLDEVKSIPPEVLEEEMIGRRDLRHLNIVTIDGDDTKDIDDAISISKLPNGNFALGVHIADVTHYVKEQSNLDKEALDRGTSVYLVDRVIPMLPRELSNGICSLNPKVDRLALSCLMEVDHSGQVVNHEIVESVIQSREQMTYNNVRKILIDKDPEVTAQYSDYVDMFFTMEELAEILMQKRFDRGSIDFDFTETKVILDDKGHPVEIKPYERNIATRIIEEFMILCNETVSEEYSDKKIPFVYRVHDIPMAEKISRLGLFLSCFGEKIEGKLTPKTLQETLDKFKGREEENAVSQVVLRSLQKARYSDLNVGHFGLASQHYSHFTSPIRRYPDLQIHRIIKQNINGELSPKKLANYKKNLSKVCEQCSDREVRAAKMEMDSVKLKKVEFMQGFVGKGLTFDAIIVGVQDYGLYVQLENTVDGLVHVRTLGSEYFVYDEYKFTLTGEKSGKEFRIGQPVKVKLIKVDFERREIDFEII